jgi:DNA-binding GntR family transcriptional regulator
MGRGPRRAKNGGRSIYEQIKRDILTLALRPGQDIDEMSLCRRYGVSRTPIREALIQLGAERLVVFSPNRGARVSSPVLNDYPRFMEALDLMRRAVCHLAANRRHPSDLAKMRSAEAVFAKTAAKANVPDEDMSDRIAEAENELNIRIAEGGHNGHLTESFERLLTVGHRMLRLPHAYVPQHSDPIATYLQRMVDHYRALIDAIEAGDADAAERSAHALTREAMLRMRAYLEENLADSVTVGGTFDVEKDTMRAPERKSARR